MRDRQARRYRNRFSSTQKPGGKTGVEAIHKETGYRNLRGLESKIPKPAAGDDLLEAEGSAISFKTCLKPPAGAVWITLERELAMTGNDDFRLEWHGKTVVITPAANV